MIQFLYCFLGIYPLFVCFNFFTLRLFNRLTKYKNNDNIGEDIWGILYVFVFGVLLFLFTRKIKKIRKINFLRKRLNYYNMIYRFDDIYSEKIRKIELILKLEMLKKKSK